MRIIKQGVNPEGQPIIKKCSKCLAEFEYVRSDIESDWRDGDYVVCPCCGQFINVDRTLNNVDRLRKYIDGK